MRRREFFTNEKNTKHTKGVLASTLPTSKAIISPAQRVLRNDVLTHQARSIVSRCFSCLSCIRGSFPMNNPGLSALRSPRLLPRLNGSFTSALASAFLDQHVGLSALALGSSRTGAHSVSSGWHCRQGNWREYCSNSRDGWRSWAGVDGPPM